SQSPSIVMLIALTRSFDRAGRDAVVGQAARLEKFREVAAFPELRDAQLHCACTPFPQPLAMAVALVIPSGCDRYAGAGHLLDLQLHQVPAVKRIISRNRLTWNSFAEACEASSSPRLSPGSSFGCRSSDQPWRYAR